MDAFDLLLEEVDDFGTYQRLLLAFVLLPGFVPVGFHAYNQLFMAATPEHFCKVPALEIRNFSLEFIRNLSIPLEERDGKLMYSQCLMYDLDYGDTNFDPNIMVGERDSPHSPSAVIPCKYGWVYDKSTYNSTAVTEWDLVCDKKLYPTLALVLLGVGGIFGTYLFGVLQDTWGRKPPFFLFLMIQCAFGMGSGLAMDFWTWLITRIGVGFTVPALMATPFVLALELVGAERRSLCTIVLNVGYSMCLMGLAGVAYLFRDFRALAFATTLPFITFFSFWWVMPESPRFLFAHGKLKETEEILRQMADVNGRTLPVDFDLQIQIQYDQSQIECDTAKEGKFTLLDLLRGKVLRRNTFIITFIWFTTMGVYVGLSYYAPVLGGDEYLNFFLAGLAEMPTYLFLFPCLDMWGRRWTLFSSLILGGVACVSTILVSNEAWITLTLYCIGKFGISAGFVAIQQIAAEIYPTVVRGLGISFSNVVGMIGPALVPLVNHMGQDYLYLPLLCLGTLMVIGGMSSLALPETLGRSLPQTLEDAEEFKVDCSKASCCPSKSRKNSSRSVTRNKNKGVRPQACHSGVEDSFL